MLTVVPDAPTEVRALPRNHRRPARASWWLLAYLLPVAAAAGAGCWGAASRQLWLDEYASWWGATRSWPEQLRLHQHIDAVQGPYYALLHVWIRVAGDTPLAMRAPSIAAGVVAVAVAMVLAQRMYGRAAAALTGIGLVAVPYFDLYQQTARPYAAAVALAGLSAWMLIRALERPTAARWACYGAAVAALGAMHLVALMVLGAHAAAVAVEYARRPATRRRLAAGWMVTAVLVVAAVAPLLWRGHAQSFQIGEGVNTANQAVFLVTYAFWSKMSAAVIVWGAVLGACLLRTAPAQRMLLVAWAVLPYALAVPTVGLLNLASLRYLLFALPPWVILASAALARMAQSPARYLRALMPALLVVSVACAVPGQVDVRRDPFVGYPDYRAAVDAIAAGIEPGDGFAQAGLVSPGSRRIAVEYRFRNAAVRPRDMFAARPAQDAGWFLPDYCEIPEGCVQPAPRVWLVTTSTEQDPFSQTGFPTPRPGGTMIVGTRIGSYLRQNYRVDRIDQFEGVRLVLLVRNHS